MNRNERASCMDNRTSAEFRKSPSRPVRHKREHLFISEPNGAYSEKKYAHLLSVCPHFESAP
jgi:hypothetical protein